MENNIVAILDQSQVATLFPKLMTILQIVKFETN